MLNQHTLGNGVIGFLCAATGPMAIILATTARGHLSDADTASWVAAGYGLPAFLTLGFSLSYRQPMPSRGASPPRSWSARRSSGSSFAECIGAYLATGALIAVLGATGLGKRAVPLQATTRHRTTGKRARELAGAIDAPIFAAAIGAGTRILVTHNIRHFR